MLFYVLVFLLIRKDAEWVLNKCFFHDILNDLY